MIPVNKQNNNRKEQITIEHMFVIISKFTFARNSTNVLVRSHINIEKKFQSNKIEEIIEWKKLC